MIADDPQSTWSDYYARKQAERLGEATAMWQRMQADGVRAETVLALDFVHFGTEPGQLDALAAQLAENYATQVVPAAEAGYWRVEGTTRPYGIGLEGTQLADWVAFMADAARSHGCVFSTWELEAPALGKRYRSEDFGD